MDWLDKKIIIRLLGCCRASYHDLARELGVTCPTIKNRVDRLRQLGVIQRFSVELSHEALGVQWVMSELHTNRSEKKYDLLRSFEAQECIREVLLLGGGRYLIFAEVPSEKRSDYSECLKMLHDVEYIEARRIEPVPTGQLRGKCMFTTRGGTIALTESDVTVLRCLVNNARAPIKRISEITGYSNKHVRKVIRNLSERNGIYFTIRLDLPSCGEINLVMRSHIADSGANPSNLASWMSDRFPEEHWFTYHAPQTNELMHYMTVKKLTDVDRLVREASLQDSVDDVQAEVIHSAMRTEGRSERLLRTCCAETINRLALGISRASEITDQGALVGSLSQSGKHCGRFQPLFPEDRAQSS